MTTKTTRTVVVMDHNRKPVGIAGQAYTKTEAILLALEKGLLKENGDASMASIVEYRGRGRDYFMIILEEPAPDTPKRNIAHFGSRPCGTSFPAPINGDLPPLEYDGKK